MLFLAIAAVIVVMTATPGEPQGDPGADGPHASPALAAQVLRAWSDALGDPTPEAMAALAPNGDAEAERLLVNVGHNVDVLGLTAISARYVDRAGPVRDDGSWTATVALTWRTPGRHRRPAYTRVLVAFAPDADSLGIVGFGGPSGDGRRTPLWLQERLTVVRGPHLLVAVGGSSTTAQQVARRVRRGIAVVSQTLPDWRPDVVVQVPSAATALDAALGVSPGTYAGVAAVTATDDGSSKPGAPTSIYLNPDLDLGASRGDAQVVMSHEIAHLATDAPRSSAPVWLLEGFADYVALRRTTVPDEVLLGRAIAQVRTEGLPSRLPPVHAFNASADDLAAAYEMAWLACRVVADRLGTSGLVDLYRSIDGGTPLGRALRDAGMPRTMLLREWRSRLQDLAG